MNADTHPAPKIAICVATRERPEGLTRLLTSLRDLEFRALPGCQVEVCIADNDTEQSAKAVCDRFAHDFPFALNYCHEPETGISFARNASIRQISSDANFVAFIDDDEVPSNDWLEQLVRVQRAQAADVVFGPAVPVFPDEAPDWVMKGGFFDTLKYRTGDQLRYGATNNALVRREVIDRFDPVFDPLFALTGGSDHHFFMRVHNAGFKLVWCDTAVVREWIPKSRMTLNWILMRAFRTSSHHVLCEKEIYPGPRVFLLRTLTGCGRLAYGICSLPFTIPLPTQSRVKALMQVFRGAGLISGLFGYRRYKEYATIHKA